jgi:hypothetical protein
LRTGLELLSLEYGQGDETTETGRKRRQGERETRRKAGDEIGRQRDKEKSIQGKRRRGDEGFYASVR